MSSDDWPIEVREIAETIGISKRTCRIYRVFQKELYNFESV
jgi:hypothetical protein